MKIFPSASASAASAALAVVLACSSAVPVALAYTNTNTNTPNKSPVVVSRRDAFGFFTAAVSVAASVFSSPEPALAFDGAGSSAYSGRSPASKAALKKQWQDRVAADVQDFNALGGAIINSAGQVESQGQGQAEGQGQLLGQAAWVNFFIEQQRREPDAVGRTYAALVDFRGLPTGGSKTSFEGGDGFLLANAFTKTGKPPETTLAVKSFHKLSKAFDPLRAAGEKGDVAKTKTEWQKTSALLSQYLVDVDMPGDLNDPRYK
jgi:hypothetical protein